MSPEIDLRKAHQLALNKKPKVCFQGQTPGVTEGFSIEATDITLVNKLKTDSAGGLHPSLGGDEILHELGPTRWIIDIAETDSVTAAQKYPVSLAHLKEAVLPIYEQRAKDEAKRNAEIFAANPNARPNRHHPGFLNTWWQLNYRRKDMLTAIEKLDRYIILTIHSNEKRQSIYTFVDKSIRPEASTVVFGFADDYSLGIHQSSLHRQWFEARCSTLETRLRYTSTTVFDSFPWPQEPTEEVVETIAKVMGEIVDMRAKYMDDGLTLAKQYDALRSVGKSKLRNLHAQLDKLVYKAYEFSEAIDPLAQLFALNQEVNELGAVGHGPGGQRFAKTRFSDYKLESAL